MVMLVDNKEELEEEEKLMWRQNPFQSGALPDVVVHGIPASSGRCQR
jgi:hypothetical protein